MRPDEHYCIPPLSRLDQGELLTLIRQKRYFVLHAPRQTGKTSALLALRDLLIPATHLSRYGVCSAVDLDDDVAESVDLCLVVRVHDHG